MSRIGLNCSLHLIQISARRAMAGLWASCLSSALPFACPASAATDPSTHIINIAHLELPVGGVTESIASNQAELIVGELLDLVLRPMGTGVLPQAAGATLVPFSLTNTGNGPEAFDLAGSLDGSDGAVRVFAIDLDGDGLFDPEHDRVLDGGRTPELASGANLALLAVLDPPADVGATGPLNITARCATGIGAPGTVFGGQGFSGSDAVVGASGGTARLALPLLGGTAMPSLVKTQSVRAADGSSRPSSGAVVTYFLEARFAGPARGVHVVDPIPAGTTYVPGSLQLDASPLTDAADADPGAATGDRVDILLGDIATPVSHIVQFKVVIQ